jgi:hypothetical protein
MKQRLAEPAALSAAQLARSVASHVELGAPAAPQTPCATDQSREMSPQGWLVVK